MNALICIAVLSAAAAVAIGGLAVTVLPNLDRITAALFRQPHSPRPETSREHWRRVHLAADKARGEA